MNKRKKTTMSQLISSSSTSLPPNGADILICIIPNVPHKAVKGIK